MPKPKKQEKVQEFVARPHLIDFSDCPAHPTFDKASLALSKINGGFQRFVVSRPDGQFVPVCMLLPTEFTPDIRAACERFGAHVMLGVAHASVEVKRGAHGDE